MGNEQSGVRGNTKIGAKSKSSGESERSAEPLVDNVVTNEQEQVMQAGIVVVHSGADADSNFDDDSASLIEQLRCVPLCYPMLPSSIGLEDEAPFAFGVKPTLAYFTRLQSHLKKSAKAVAFDQASVITRIRETDEQATQLHQMVSGRQARLAGAAEQIRKSRDLASTLSRVQMNLQDTARLANQLNQMLPASERLEPFVLLQPSASSINQ